MKVMVFDVGGTEIKYSVMDEQFHREDAGSVPTPDDTQEHFLATLEALYRPHAAEVDGIALSLSRPTAISFSCYGIRDNTRIRRSF